MCPVGGAKSEKNASAGMHAKSKIGFLEKDFVYRKLANIPPKGLKVLTGPRVTHVGYTGNTIDK